LPRLAGVFQRRFSREIDGDDYRLPVTEHTTTLEPGGLCGLST
jgi:hypothetical protein